MNRLSKVQQALLECALDKLYTFLKEKFNVNYKGSIHCIVYDNLVKLNQGSTQDYITWEVNIWLEERRIHIVTRKVECHTIYSKRKYNTINMGSVPTIFNLNF